MSLFGSLFASVAGLGAQSRAMGMISDNIANVNTTAYKGAEASFANLVTNAAGAASYTPGGVRSIASYDIEGQGLIQGSASPTHVAVTGNGFFAVNALPDGSGQNLYTRDGAFEPDRFGNLKTPSGFYLQAWKLDGDGAIADPNNLETVNVAGVTGVATPTTAIDIGANLDADTPPHAAAYAPGNLADGSVDAHFERSVQVYDSLGRGQSVTLGYLKTAPSTWAVEAWVTGTTAPIPTATGDVVFNTDGTFASTTFPASVTATWPDGDANPSALAFNFGTPNTSDGLTQFSAPTDVSFVKQDGAAVGELNGVSIDADGYLVASFTNGEIKNLYQLPLAIFANANGLSPRSGNVFEATQSSGAPSMKAAGIGGAGSLTTSSLETANVDLADEFTKMIVTQRAYSANARVITTANDMLSELVQLSR